MKQFCLTMLMITTVAIKIHVRRIQKGMFCAMVSKVTGDYLVMEHASNYQELDGPQYPAKMEVDV